MKDILANRDIRSRDTEAPPPPEETPYQKMREKHVYWAALPLDEIVPKLEQRAEWYWQHVESTGRLALWRRLMRVYRGYDPKGGFANSAAVTFSGEVGEVVRLQTNHFAGLIQGVHSLVTGVRPTTKAIAAAGTSEAQDDASVADKILEWDLKQKGVESVMSRAALIAMHSGEGWVYQYWDHMSGREVSARQDGSIQYEGDIITLPVHPHDVVRDPDSRLEGDQPHEWLMVRIRVNRWTLMRQFPEHADAIANVHDTKTQDARELFGRRTDHVMGKEDDYIYLWHWYHDTTPALPMGRFVAFVEGQGLMESPLPYADLPLHPIYPDVDDEVAFGFTPMVHLLAPQQAYDSIMSAVHTNIDAGGINNFWIPSGEAISVEDLAGGLNVIRSAIKPEVIQFGQIGGDAVKLLEVDEANMEKLSGMNSVTRGQPDDSLKSGAALALVQSMSVQHNSGHQRGYAGLIERVTSARVRIWQRYVTEERVAEIAGDDERVSAQKWTGKSLHGVSRIAVELSNPLMGTSEGRMRMADRLSELAMAVGQPLRMEEYIAVLETGRLEPITKGPREEYRLVARENDALRHFRAPPPQPGGMDPMTGEELPPPPLELPVKVVRLDDHQLHIGEHKTLLADPAVRFDDSIAAGILQHIAEHEMFLAPAPMVDPMTGEPMPPEMGPGGPHPPMMAPEEDAGPPIPMESMPTIDGQPGAQLPNMPTNPATGEPARVQGGF